MFREMEEEEKEIGWLQRERIDGGQELQHGHELFRDKFLKISQRNLPGKQEERTRDKKGKNRKQRSFLGTDLVF